MLAKESELPGLTPFVRLLDKLPKSPATWTITDVARFTGANLLETLLRAGQTVRGLDNFVSGKKKIWKRTKAKSRPHNGPVLPSLKAISAMIRFVANFAAASIVCCTRPPLDQFHALSQIRPRPTNEYGRLS